MFVFTEPTTRGRSAGRAAAERRVQGLELDRVAERGTGAVRLHVGRRRRARRPRTPRAWRITACCARPFGTVRPLLAPVLVDRGPADHREDVVAVGLRIGEPLEDHDPAALGAHEPVGRCVEGLAPAVRRQHAPAREDHERLRGAG